MGNTMEIIYNDQNVDHSRIAYSGSELHTLVGIPNCSEESVMSADSKWKQNQKAPVMYSECEGFYDWW